MSISPQGGLISPSDNAEEDVTVSHSGIVWTWLDPVCWTAVSAVKWWSHEYFNGHFRIRFIGGTNPIYVWPILFRPKFQGISPEHMAKNMVRLRTSMYWILSHSHWIFGTATDTLRSRGETLVGRLGSIGGPFQYEDEILLHTLWFNMVFIWFTDGMIMG